MSQIPIQNFKDRFTKQMFRKTDYLASEGGNRGFAVKSVITNVSIVMEVQISTQDFCDEV